LNRWQQTLRTVTRIHRGCCRHLQLGLTAVQAEAVQTFYTDTLLPNSDEISFEEIRRDFVTARCALAPFTITSLLIQPNTTCRLGPKQICSSRLACSSHMRKRLTFAHCICTAPRPSG